MKNYFIIIALIILMIGISNAYEVTDTLNVSYTVASYTVCGGWLFKLTTGNATLTSVLSYAGVTATTIGIYNNGSATPIKTFTWTGSNTSVNFSLVNNTVYAIAIGSNGSGYNRGYSNSNMVPQTFSNAIFYKGWACDETSGSEWNFNIQGIGISFPNPVINNGSVYFVQSTKQPSDINSSLIGFIYFNASIQAQNDNFSVFGNSHAELVYNTTTALNNRCVIFEQKRCVNNGSFITKNMTFFNYTSFPSGQTWYNTTLTEKDIFPAYYPFNEAYIESATSQNYTVYQNHDIRFIVYNFSTYTNPFISMEFDSINLSGTSLMNVYYCNSSYSSGNPATDNNCQFLQNIPAVNSNFSHCHNPNSCHYVFPVVINNVTKTQLSSFIVTSSITPITNGYNFRYVTNSSYDNTSFQTGTFGAWTANVSNIFDMHLHQFLGNDTFNYYIRFTDNNNATNTSVIYTDALDVLNQPPSAVNILRPNISERPVVSLSVNSSIFFQWTPSTDFENDALTYNLSVVNSLGVHKNINSQLNQSFNNFTASVNAVYLPMGNYTTHIITCDNRSNCVESNSHDFVICQNSYSKSVQPCVSGAKLIVYQDDNHCSSFLDSVPSDNGTYESCIEIVYQQKVFEEDKWILLVLTIFFVISLIGGIAIHEGFFGLCALLLGLAFAVFIYYDYPQILMFADVFMIIMFVVMWIVIHRVRRG